MKLRRLVSSACLVAVGLGAASSAQAETVRGLQQAQHVVRAAGLRPTPLFPQQEVPMWIRRLSRAEVTIDGQRFVVNLPLAGNGYVMFSRGRKSALANDLRVARLKRIPTPRRQFGNRLVYSLCEIACGYEWHEQGFAYAVFARPGTERAVYDRAYRSLPRIIAGLTTLASPAD